MIGPLDAHRQNMKSSLPILVFLGVVLTGCSSSSSEPTPATDTTLSNPDSDAGNHCAPADNPEGCPAQYSEELGGNACATPGLQCEYPGESDDYGVCGDYALLRCIADDGGSAVWQADQ